MITILINDKGFQAEFSEKIAKAKNPKAVLAAAGGITRSELKKYFIKKYQTQPNKLSPRRSQFWYRVSKTISLPQMAGYNSVSVSITHPAFAQKVFGGVIRAKLAGALTIPVEERAYDRTAKNFEHDTGLKLFLLKVGKTKANAFQNAVLAVAEAGHITVEYILTPSVNQQPDPTALPPTGQLEQAILAQAQKVLDREMGAK